MTRRFDILPEAVKAVRAVQNYGVLGWYGHSLPCIASLATVPGDYIEIGTYYGASAIAVGLVRKELGIPGKIVCVDPLYTGTVDPFQNYPKDHQELTAERILNSASHFGVDLELITKRSIPWPEELRGRTFSVAYIDGDHRFPHAGCEATVLSNLVTAFIAFDDFEPHNISIREAVWKLLLYRLDWTLYYKNEGFIVLSRNVSQPPLLSPFALVDMNFNYSLLSTGGTNEGIS